MFPSIGNSRFECSADFLTLVFESTGRRRESRTGCLRIRSKTASCGITRICAVTVYTNTYIRVGPIDLRIYRLHPSASFGLYKGPRAELKYTLCRSTILMTGVLTSGQWGYPIKGLVNYGVAEEKKPSFMRFTSEQPRLPQSW